MNPEANAPSSSATAIFLDTEYSKLLYYPLVVAGCGGVVVFCILAVRLVFLLFFSQPTNQPLLSQRTLSLQRRLSVVTLCQVSISPQRIWPLGNFVYGDFRIPNLRIWTDVPGTSHGLRYFFYTEIFQSCTTGACSATACIQMPIAFSCWVALRPTGKDWLSMH